MNLRDTAALVALALVLLLFAAVASVSWMTGQRDEALRTGRDLEDCRVAAAAIEKLRSKPTVAASQAIEVHELAQRIEQASRMAQLKPTALEGVFPGSARRLGDSPYLLKPTSVSLRGVTLAQLTGMLVHLTDASGLSVRELRMRTPRGDDTGQAWDAEATLTYLIYAPRDSAGRGEP